MTCESVYELAGKDDNCHVVYTMYIQVTFLPGCF
jgi:hypothetical protein